LSKSGGDGYGMIPATPYGNDILADLAIEAIDETELGRDEHTDVLAISFSSTDYVGHNFGPRSVEIEDTYLRLDRNIAAILDELDDRVGRGNYTVFLTADHGVADVPKYLMDNHVPAGYFRTNGGAVLMEFMTDQFGEGAWIRNISNYQVFLNRDLILEKGLDLAQVRARIATAMLKTDGIAATFTAEQLIGSGFDEAGIKGMYVRGYNHKRSGDVAFSLEPGWLASGQDTGTSHGSAYKYDTHVPMIFFGKGIRQGKSFDYHTITDIAPTISGLLNITVPDAATGDMLGEVIDLGADSE